MYVCAYTTFLRACFGCSLYIAYYDALVYKRVRASICQPLSPASLTLGMLLPICHRSHHLCRSHFCRHCVAYINSLVNGINQAFCIQCICLIRIARPSVCFLKLSFDKQTFINFMIFNFSFSNVRRTVLNSTHCLSVHSARVQHIRFQHSVSIQQLLCIFPEFCAHVQPVWYNATLPALSYQREIFYLVCHTTLESYEI